MPEKSVGIKVIISVDGKEKLEAVPALFLRLGKEAEKMAKAHKVSYDKIIGLYNRMGLSSREYTQRISHDNSYLAQSAREFSKNFGVSLEDAMSLMRGVGATSDKEWKGIGVDMKKGEKYAQEFSQNFGVSIDNARSHVEKLGLQTKRFQNVVHHDMDAATKTARAWSKNWGTSFKNSYLHVKRTEDEVRKTFPEISMSMKSVGQRAKEMSQTWGISMDKAMRSQKDMVKEVKNGGAAISNLAKTTETSAKKMKFNLTLVAWHFRYLGNIMDRVAKGIVRAIKDVITVTSELEESFLSISVAGAIFGRDAEKASEFAKELARKGLMPLQDAANITKNLMITGLGLPELEKFTYRYLDVAFLFTSGADEMAESLDKTASSILRGTTMLGADNTMKALWIQTEKRLEKTIGMTMKQLTAEQRALELLITIEKEWASTQDLHQIELETTRAAMTRLNYAITEIKNAFGIALLPLLHAVSDAMVKVSVYTRALLNVMGSAVPVIVAVGLVFTWLTAKISFSIGVFISVMKIAGMTAAMMWKIYLPVLAIGAVVAGVTYLWLKHTGALDKAANSAAKMKEQLSKLTDEFTGLEEASEESEEVDESRKLAHERATADIMEDLERERSKGLWANQMSIKDLEKRLRRENEDWELYLKEKGKADEAGGKATGNVLDNLLQDVNDTVEELGKIDWFKGLKDPKRWAEVRDSILNFVDGITEMISNPTFWKNFGIELAKNMGKIITGIGDVVKAAFEGLFGSVMKGIAVTSALTFVTLFGVSLLKHFAAGGIGFLSVTSAGAAITAALLAAIPLTLAITVTLLTTAALYNAIKFKEQINALYNSVDSAIDLNNQLFTTYRNQFREGILGADEFKRKIEDLNRSSRDLITNANEARWQWGEFFSGEYLKSGLQSLWHGQTGGIVPGMRNQPVPIIAHGGERVIPAGEVAGGGNISINFGNVSVRNDQDIQEIARQVSSVLGQRNRWAKMGGF